jgi:uncharacterized protein (TIGR02118 family)
VIYYTVMVYRRSDLTQAEFESVWLGEHASLARRVPGVVGVEFMPRYQLDDQDRGPHGVGRLLFDDVESLSSALGSAEAKVLRQHTAVFADSNASVRMIAKDPD